MEKDRFPDAVIQNVNDVEVEAPVPLRLRRRKDSKLIPQNETDNKTQDR